MASYIAVHGGAGYHDPSHDKRTRRALRSACIKVLENLRQKDTYKDDVPAVNKSLDMVEDAIVVLEDDAYLNAGYGSNLTLNGTVECDAAIFAATPRRSGHFGSVGAVSGIKNPISLAYRIWEYSTKRDKLCRVPPMTLVSQGAVDFAKTRGMEHVIVSPESMISSEAKANWTKWKERLEDADVSGQMDPLDEEQEVGEGRLQDTVGAVAWHSSSGMAAGVSSGGLLLKLPGRIGEAAVYGAGCWAQHYDIQEHEIDSCNGMACSVSGTGEQIIYANLARTIAEAYHTSREDPHELLRHVLVEKFYKPAKALGEKPAAGVVMLTKESEQVHLWCAFTTRSMAIAYASSADPQPKTHILRRPDGPRSSADEPHVYITAFHL